MRSVETHQAKQETQSLPAPHKEQAMHSASARRRRKMVLSAANKLTMGRVFSLSLGLLTPLVLMLGPSTSSAPAATPGPGFVIQATTHPTNFTPENLSGTDSYDVVVTNVGSQATSGSGVTIADTLPEHIISAKSVELRWSGIPGLNIAELVPCTVGAETHCELPAGLEIAPGGYLELVVHVAVETGAAQSVLDRATVEGGGALPVSTSLESKISPSPAPFGISNVGMSITGVDGAPDTQAGDHPYAVTTNLDFDTVPGSFNNPWLTPEGPKDVVVDLPMGLVGNPTAAPECPLVDLHGEDTKIACPADTKIGEVQLMLPIGVQSSSQPGFDEVGNLYNLVPEHGYPAEFGFTYLGQGVHLYANTVLTGAGYVVQVVIPGVPTISDTVLGASVTIFGDPAQRDGSGTPAAFFTNPLDCQAGAETFSAYADSWQHPAQFNADGSPDLGDPNWKEAQTTLAPFTGCNVLPFAPTIETQPQTTQVDTPDGPRIGIEVPQSESLTLPASSALHDASVTLPAGMSLSPAAGSGLQACSAAQFAEASRKPAACPPASQIGTVKVTTPLLVNPLEGQLFVAEPECGAPAHPAPCGPADAQDGRLFRLFMQVQGSGVTLKLSGTANVNTESGQLTTSFQNTPELPFSKLQIALTQGPRAPLANPQSCGTATTSAVLTPWGAPEETAEETPEPAPSSLATPSSLFTVGGCASPMPFNPGFSGGTLVPQASGFSPFTTTISRADGEQDLARVSVQTPPGLLGMLATVPLCEEPQAAEGSCSSSAQIGTTWVAAGAGSQPLWLQGRVYLTGPYNGEPFGLSIVVPAVAGPFNLGEEVVRAAIAVNPHTGQLTVTSNPLPQSKDGVPFRLKEVRVEINRQGFIFNPTNCTQQHVAGTISGALPDGAPGTTASVSAPFAAVGCRNLPFDPSFAAATKGKTSKADGASLTVKVAAKPGEANIAATRVEIPKQLPARLTTLHEACLEAVFNANPAGCPAGADVGSAIVHTPVLPVPLEGPAYFVSHGSAKFPELVIVLQGDGVTIDLAAETDINTKTNVTSSTFQSVPDAPFSTFELNLPERANSALSATPKHLCTKKLTMPTTITAQNGIKLKRLIKIAVTGCPKKTTAKAHKLAKRRTKRR